MKLTCIPELTINLSSDKYEHESTWAFEFPQKFQLHYKTWHQESTIKENNNRKCVDMYSSN